MSFIDPKLLVLTSGTYNSDTELKLRTDSNYLEIKIKIKRSLECPLWIHYVTYEIEGPINHAKS